MDILELLYSRRSIRKYHEKPVSNDTLELLIRAAASAPTAANNQPWEFIVVNEKDIMDNLRKGLFLANIMLLLRL